MRLSFDDGWTARRFDFKSRQAELPVGLGRGWQVVGVGGVLGRQRPPQPLEFVAHQTATRECMNMVFGWKTCAAIG